MQYFMPIAFIISLMTALPALAAQITCPSAIQVKQVKLVRAIQHPYDPDCWNFTSTVFTHEGNTWNVEFGTFLPGVQQAKEALKQGQVYFDQSPVIIKNPEPFILPSKQILCEYTPTGRLYWLSASTPPNMKITHVIK